MGPFVWLLTQLLNLFWWCIFISVVLNVLIYFSILNPYNRFVGELSNGLTRLTEPVLGRIRRFLPDLGGIDISPVLALLFIQFLQIALETWSIPYR